VTLVLLHCPIVIAKTVKLKCHLGRSIFVARDNQSDPVIAIAPLRDQCVPVVTVFTIGHLVVQPGRVSILMITLFQMFHKTVKRPKNESNEDKDANGGQVQAPPVRLPF